MWFHSILFSVVQLARNWTFRCCNSWCSVDVTRAMAFFTMLDKGEANYWPFCVLFFLFANSCAIATANLDNNMGWICNFLFKVCIWIFLLWYCGHLSTPKTSPQDKAHVHSPAAHASSVRAITPARLALARPRLCNRPRRQDPSPRRRPPHLELKQKSNSNCGFSLLFLLFVLKYSDHVTCYVIDWAF